MTTKEQIISIINKIEDEAILKRILYLINKLRTLDDPEKGN